MPTLLPNAAGISNTFPVRSLPESRAEVKHAALGRMNNNLAVSRQDAPVSGALAAFGG